jgi:hypothetical protein
VAPPGNRAGAEKTNIRLQPEERTETRAIESDRRAGGSLGHGKSYGRQRKFGTPEAERRRNRSAEPETRRLKARKVEAVSRPFV